VVPSTLTASKAEETSYRASAAAIVRNVGVAAEPVIGPARKVFADSLARLTSSVPDVVIGVSDTVRNDGTVMATLDPGLVALGSLKSGSLHFASLRSK
jgi:hypothetical protein